MWFIGVEVEQETSAPPPNKILDPPLCVMYSLPPCSLFLLFSLFSRKLQGLPNNLLHTTKTTQSIYFILLYIFNYIPKQRILKGKDKKYKRLRHSITKS